MSGLIILLIIGIYLAVVMVVARLTYWLIFKATESKKKSSSTSKALCVVMVLLPFWDLIPVLVMHKYYCSTQAGFWVDKTPEEWIEENPDVAKSLKNFDESKIEYLGKARMKFHINDVFVEEIRRSVEVFHGISKEEIFIFDKKIVKC